MPNISKGLIIIVGITLIVILFIYMAFYFLQDRILFFPQGITDGRTSEIQTEYSNVEEVTLRVDDEISLHGWYIKNEKEPSSPLLIYFGGNAEEVSHLMDSVTNISTHSVVLINYRGYGKSTGSPGEAAMFSDALAIYDYMAEKTEINKERISVMGRSMGTGVAVYLAAEREIDHVILVSPYDSLVNVARDRYPFVPVSLLLKHRFENIDRAPQIESPLLMYIASEDTLIPPAHSERLAEHWKGNNEVIYFEGYDHNNIQTSNRYWDGIMEFLE
ncbi:alpha/beta hydrolase [Evansella sp. AB-rgal1]|uniref:alpha/beta hydrolase n=1 Tax=Evansella sp. AB-rgal1 TaxID=3242696 RepID=UPI00359D74F4